MAAFRGSLLRLFGEPLHFSDAQYDYIIEATDSEGNVWILTANDASGAAIGGDAFDESIYPVAMALRGLIEQTPPADFEAIFYTGEEFDSTVTYGCKDGVCYYREERSNHVP